MRPPIPVSAFVALAILASGVVGLQAYRDQRTAPQTVNRDVLYIQSGNVLKRLVLSYDALAADVYWMRALQHFGRTKLSSDPNKRYAELSEFIFDLVGDLALDWQDLYSYMEGQWPGITEHDSPIDQLTKGTASSLITALKNGEVAAADAPF